MKSYKIYTSFLIPFFVIVLLFSCENKKEKHLTENTTVKSLPKKENSQEKKISPEFKKYWYSGTAEISSYQLNQVRYGEMREGKSVLIYVTEPFLADKQVKADQSNPTNIPVLKLNTTKKYFTGVYPYSIMTSSFYSVNNNQHATKVSFSAQEWCGHVYAQINNKKDFKVSSYSYFEKEGDQMFSIKKEILENELWNKIRIDPSTLPVGDLKIIPSLEFVRLSHKELKSYEAIAILKTNENLSTYSITYPELQRNLTIQFSSTFPYKIEGWEDTFNSGYGENKKKFTSSAKRIKTITSPYWRKNKNKDLYLRDSLGL